MNQFKDFYRKFRVALMINQILRDIYHFDNRLVKYEDKLWYVLKQKIESRSDLEFDDNFEQNIKRELANQISSLVKADIEVPPRQWPDYVAKYFYIKNFLGLIFVVVLFSLPFFYSNYGDHQLSNPPFTIFDSENIANTKSIVELDHEAYGKLNLELFQDQTNTIFSPINYKFIYRGDLLPLDKDQRNIYSNIPVYDQDTRRFARFVNIMGIDLIDLSAFPEAEIDKIHIKQKGNFGQNIAIDLSEESIVIDYDKENWPNLYQNCWQAHKSQEEVNECRINNRLRPENLPSEERLIGITNDYLLQYGIDKANFGKPIIDYSWREGYENKLREYEQNNTLIPPPSLPEDVKIVYPILIEDSAVYDEYLNTYGLIISVNIRYLKVSGIQHLNAQRYGKSSYESVSDWGVVLKYAEKGGQFINLDNTYAEQVQEILLGKPEIVLVKNALNNRTLSQYLYIPSLVFPIINNPDQDLLNQDYVIVPLIEDLLQQKAEVTF